MNKQFYSAFNAAVAAAREKHGRPLTFVEKIIAAHQADPDQQHKRGKVMLQLKGDRVALQDATAQMALLQFILTEKPQPAVPTSIHCDHLILAKVGAELDLASAITGNKEVYDFLADCGRKFGIDFWAPGSGIIHQTVLENYAFPGGVLIGTDSHTPNAGGAGMLACGAGGGEAAQIMAGQPWEVLYPEIVGVHLTGELPAWCNPKDVITYLCTLLTTKGGTNKVFEYFGPGAASISATGKATICNMGAELGATGSVFPADAHTVAYFRSTGREELAAIVKENLSELAADDRVEIDPTRYFDEVIEINLSKLEPCIVGPHSPDRGRPVTDLFAEAKKEGWPTQISAALIGSCTNSSYSDLARVAAILRQLPAGQKLKTKLFISPGSEAVLETIRRDGILKVFEDAGAIMLSNSCGPCIGNWDRTGLTPGEPNTVVSSFNRNFKKRNDGNPETLMFLTSPEVVAAMAITGTLDFSEATAILAAPPEVEDPMMVLAATGLVSGPADPTVNLEIAPDSTRLQFLTPFAPRKKGEFEAMTLLVKLSGKTTTDHISQAGPWLKFRGHLPNISDNMLLGAVNAFTKETGTCRNPITGDIQPYPAVAKYLKANDRPWIIVGDENYGEGSSREHAALSPRLLGCGVVIVRSFARIHETNLKLQGVLPLTFVNPEDYNQIEEGDTFDVSVENLTAGVPVNVQLNKSDGTKVQISCSHTLTTEQITWFWAGSCLNAARAAA
jgi:aconitate hydratase